MNVHDTGWGWGGSVSFTSHCEGGGIPLIDGIFRLSCFLMIYT